MNTISTLKDDLADEFRHYHGWAQLRRFSGVFLGALLLQISVSGIHITGWASLGSFVAATIWTVVRQQLPTIPWPTVIRVVTQTEEAAKETPAKPSSPPAA